MAIAPLSLQKNTRFKMAKFNAENERIKREYLEWEKEANGKSDSTITNIQNYLYLYEEHTKFKNFKQFNKKDAMSFKKQLGQQQSKRKGTFVSKAYILHAVRSLNDFFKWLAAQPGYKSKIDLTEVAYFKLQEKEIQAARAQKTKRYPTLEQVEHVVKNMPSETEIQKRDRALIAFFALSGGRITAIASLQLKHVFLDDERIEQNPQEVKTKSGKKIVTYFFPVGDYLKQIFVEWVLFLKQNKLFNDSDPLFPSTKLSFDENAQFCRQELDRLAWKSTSSLRTIVKNAFVAAGLEYHNPHSFRNMIVQLGYQVCKTPEDFKAWSQNIGHNSPLTTFTSYGSIDECNQGNIIKKLCKHADKPATIADIERLLKQAMG